MIEAATVSNVANSALNDRHRLIALSAGAVAGLFIVCFNGLIARGIMDVSPAMLQLVAILILALLSGVGAALAARANFQSRLFPAAVGARLGIRAGLTSAVVAGAVLALLATADAGSAPSSELERALRSRMWIVFAVNFSALLPSVLCGFAGGLIGGRAVSRLPEKAEQGAKVEIRWLRWATLAVAASSSLGLLAPLSFLGRRPRVDPPLIVKPEKPEQSFHYTPPPDITSAKIGEIQPHITKVIAGVAPDVPVSLSTDGSLLAYGDTSSGSPAIAVYDLNRFQKIAVIKVPAYPQDSLAWSPDQRSLACTIGSNSGRLIWILGIASGNSISLPRPPGRDMPGGKSVWWQAQELAFFPTDEPPLVFDLEKLLLKSINDSPFFSKLDEDAKSQWRDGPRASLPFQKGWKLDIRTVIRSAMPPPRRSPEKEWELFGGSICAMSHPDLPIAFGFDSLEVDASTKVLCTADGSKLIRIRNGSAEVTFMKRAPAPAMHFEVGMPSADEAIKEQKWRRHVTDGELCVLVCAPLINPLNHQVVGPDYQQVRGIAQLVEWRDGRAVFVMQTYGRPVLATDIATTLHAWSDGHKTIWDAAEVKDWWSAITPIARELPPTLPDLYMPALLAFNPDESPFVVVKAAERHRPVPQTPAQSTTLIPSPLSQSPFSMLGSASAANSALFSQGSSSVTAPSPVSRHLTDIDVKEFITAHHDKAARGKITELGADYDQSVDFLDKGRLSRDAIQAEEIAGRQKWPRATEKILGTVTVSKDGGLWTANYTIEFRNENTAGEWLRGQADLTVTMTSNMGSLIIISQKAKVHDVTGSRR